ncbi:MAG: sigma 54-interacting transcriptional regulator [Polyangiaceae bacterium]
MSSVLLTWLGATDLRAAKGEASAGLGPVGQAVEARTFDQIVLLTNYEKAEVATFVGWLKKRTSTPIVVRSERLRSPTDYGDIYRAVTRTLEWLTPTLGKKGRLTFHLSPGTPAMAIVWILLAPRYGAELIQSSKERGVEAANVPFEIAAEFVPALVRQGDAKLEQMSVGLRPEDASFTDIAGRSDTVTSMVNRARQAAPYSAPILIEGESGTGKELLAAAVHKASGRKGEFVAINCGAIPRELVESTFFGHTRDAFTGAKRDKPGAFEQADGGTLFLDEVGELPLDAQVKLLRALQEKKVQRVGAAVEKPVDVRVIAATNRDLIGEVAAGRFREDLYFRLAVLLLRSPPLREREGDVLLLAEQLLDALNSERPNAEHKKLSAAAKSLLLKHRWPGNVRELQATLLRAFVWSRGTTIDDKALAEALVVRPSSTAADVLHQPIGNGFKLEESLRGVIHHYLTRALEEAHGNKTKAAALVGFKHYQTLTNWAKKHGVEL